METIAKNTPRVSSITCHAYFVSVSGAGALPLSARMLRRGNVTLPTRPQTQHRQMPISFKRIPDASPVTLLPRIQRLRP